MLRRHARSVVATLVVTTSLLAGPATAQARHPGHDPGRQASGEPADIAKPTGTAKPAHTAKPADTQHAVAKRLSALERDWPRGDDVIVTGQGDEEGFHLFVGREDSSYAFRPLVSIKPFDADDEWLGTYCLTGDRKHVVATLITRRAVNRPRHLANGGLVYSVALSDGSVRPVAVGAAVNSAGLRCGQDGRAAVLTYSTPENPTTGVFAVDAARAEARQVAKLNGQFVDPVLDRESVFLRQGGRIVRVDAARPDRAETVHDGGAALELAGVRGTTLEFAERANGRTSLRVLDLRDRKVSERASAEDARAQLVAPSSAAAGLLATEKARRGGAAAGRPRAGQYAGTKTGGHKEANTGTKTDDDKTANQGTKADDDKKVDAARPGAEMRVRDVSAEGKVALTDLPKAVVDGLGDREGLGLGNGSALVWLGTRETLRTGVQLVPGAKSGGGLPTRRMSADGGVSTQANFTTPKCAVPRNTPNRQVYGPTARQAAWAVDLATLNALGGVNSRPANYRQTGLPAYSPSSDFAIPSLKPSGGRVPPVVMNGVLAQESAYKHATWRSLPGSGGNPLIGDYYGSGGTLDVIDYDNADCGYGIAQVTTGMTATDTGISPNGKAKIAVDYAENVQAGMQILAEKWNQLHDAGIVMNNGDSALVENWYLALWAYNSGVQPNAANGNPTGCTPGPSCTDRAGNWGLGWTNNPNNDSYREGRDVFLRESYADAARPWEWPYQERVIGWTETPIKDFKGDDAYLPAVNGPLNPAGNTVSYPDRRQLCTTANRCDPTTVKRCQMTEGDLAFHCWWNGRVQMNIDCATQCARSAYDFATGDREPAGDNPWPPACQKQLPADTIIIDDLSTPNVNIFCSGVDWTNGGTFTLEYGKTAEGMPLSTINFHQLAAGLGAHTWFAGNALPSDTARRVTGTWKPNLSTNGTYMIRAHIPTAGASAGSATYKITNANGTVTERVINQHEHFNHWKSLGVQVLGPNSQIQLSNVTKHDTVGDIVTVAWDALALVPVSGTYHEDKVDAVAYFDENQNLDTIAPASWIGGKMAGRQALYDWATDLTGRVLSKPVCQGSTMSDQCVRAATRDVFTQWRDEVIQAGVDPVNHPRGKSIPSWMGFSNPVSQRPTSAYLPSWFLNDDLAYKIRTTATASFVLGSDGRIVPGSEDVDYQHRTANTHLPAFVTRLFSALSADYGITRPDIQYDLVDANVHNHQATHGNANSNGVLLARAYRFGGAPPQTRQMPGTAGGNVDCVVAHGAGGGVIGYRTLIGNDYVESQIRVWARKVADGRNAKNIPEGVAQTALDVFNMFFENHPLELGSAFAHAPPIHQELHFASCADLSLRRVDARTPVLLSSYMPDQYLYRDGQAMNLDGSSRASADPVLRGNFQNFSAIPSRANQYGTCDRFTTNPSREDQEGNPWGIVLIDGPGVNPAKMIFCSDQTLPHPDYG
ncbi:hypothetical protein [Streptosporangium sp. NPDC050280]|uniref:golvesin C-terminal-like domain-containing protein n=1 Tax=unclassified Streptosporangium TaxID=2632669 RepID=UPI003420708E